MIRLLCVEDDQMMRGYLTTRLGCEPDILMVGEVSNANVALACLCREEVDVVLLDFQLVGMNGMQLLEDISLWHASRPDDSPRPRVLFCTGWADSGFEGQARAAGAMGVVGKDRLVTDLVPAVRAVASGGTWFKNSANAPVGDAPPRRWRVLVGDHDRPVRSAVNEILPKLDCEAVIACQCEDVLGLLERDSFHLLLLNHRLPGRPLSTGVLERVATDWPELPILWLSAMPSDMEQYRPYGNVQGVVKKPISAGQLEEQMGKALGWSTTALPPRVLAGSR